MRLDVKFSESNQNFTPGFGEVQTASDGGNGGGTTNHNALSNRDMANQHPISAITGLQEALDNIPAGSAEKEWRLLNTVELTENVSDIFVDKDSDGNPFECDEIWLVVIAKRANNTSANLRFSFHTKGLWDCVQTSGLITTNESHLRVHAYFGGAEEDLFVKLGASAYANSPVSFVSTLGSPRGDKKLRHFQLNRANADGYFGAGSIYKIYGR